VPGEPHSSLTRCSLHAGLTAGLAAGSLLVEPRVSRAMSPSVHSSLTLVQMCVQCPAHMKPSRCFLEDQSDCRGCLCHCGSLACQFLQWSLAPDVLCLQQNSRFFHWKLKQFGVLVTKTGQMNKTLSLSIAAIHRMSLGVQWSQFLEMRGAHCRNCLGITVPTSLLGDGGVQSSLPKLNQVTLEP